MLWPLLALAYPSTLRPVEELAPAPSSNYLPPARGLQALVDRVSEAQLAAGPAALHGGRPLAPTGLGDLQKKAGDATKTVAKAADGVQNMLQSVTGALGLPVRNSFAPSSEQQPKPGFSAWPQPNWWNAPPPWLDALPWWLEGYLEKVAQSGDLERMQSDAAAAKSHGGRRAGGGAAPHPGASARGGKRTAGSAHASSSRQRR